MYPLRVCLVGCSYNVEPDLKRELANLAVTIDSEWPDIRSALSQLRVSDADRCLLIVQPQSTEDLKQLERMNETFSGQPILALVDLTANGPTMLLHAMRAGAAQVVRVPLQSEDFRSAMQRIAVQFGSPPNKSKVIAVCGATGGCGATTVAINLAAEIAQLQKLSCILIEASVPLGRLASYLAVEPAMTISDLLNDVERLDIDLVRNALTKIADNFHVLVGSYKCITTLDIPAQAVVRLHNYVRQLAEVIVVDMPHTFDSTYFEFLAGVDEVVLIFEQKISSIRGAQLILESFERHGCGATPHVVINRYNASAEGFSAERIQKLLNVPGLVTIANDRTPVFRAETNGKTLRQHNSRSRALADIDELLRHVMDRPDRVRAPLTFRTVCSSLAGLLAQR